MRVDPATIHERLLREEKLAALSQWQPYHSSLGGLSRVLSAECDHYTYKG